MSPIKFEESIKEKLDKRTLQPSINAWNTLSQRLDAEHKKKNNKPFWWFGLAASIVGVLLATTVFFNTESKEHVPVIVDSPIIIQQEENSQIVIEEINTNDAVLEKGKSTKKTEKNQEKTNPTIIETNLKKDYVVVAEDVVPEVKNNTKKPIEAIQEKLTFEEQKVQDVVAQIQELQENNTNVTDAEIDALLQKAQKEITLKQLYKESTGVVDAMLLLQDVEADIDQSFRSKVFEALKANYNTVKTAVAQRNN